MESTYKKMTNITKIHISLWLLNQSDGDFAQMQIISLQFYNPKAYSDWFTILKAIDAESQMVIFGGDNRYNVCDGTRFMFPKFREIVAQIRVSFSQTHTVHEAILLFVQFVKSSRKLYECF